MPPLISGKIRQFTYLGALVLALLFLQSDLDPANYPPPLKLHILLWIDFWEKSRGGFLAKKSQEEDERSSPWGAKKCNAEMLRNGRHDQTKLFYLKRNKTVVRYGG